MVEHKFRLIASVDKGEISAEDAAAKLGIRVRTVKQLVTLHKDNLRVIVPLIDQLLKPVNTKRDQTAILEKLSELLGVTYRQVGRLVERAGVKIPAPLVVVERERKRINAKSRLFMRTKIALDVIAGLRTAKDAAEAAEVTPKHMYRMCGEMIASRGMVYRDLNHITLSKRKQLADEIEKEIYKDEHVRGETK